MTPLWIERFIISLGTGLIVSIVLLYGCVSRGQVLDADIKRGDNSLARISPPQPPIPPVPVVIGRGTNAEGPFRVIMVKEAVTNRTPKADMPPALPVSGSAPHHYYGIVEFKKTGNGREIENELLYLGLYPNEEAFRKSHGVGNTRFNRRFTAVIRSTSEIPNDPVCIWQRADGPSP